MPARSGYFRGREARSGQAIPKPYRYPCPPPPKRRFRFQPLLRVRGTFFATRCCRNRKAFSIRYTNAYNRLPRCASTHIYPAWAGRARRLQVGAAGGTLGADRDMPCSQGNAWNRVVHRRGRDGRSDGEAVGELSRYFRCPLAARLGPGSPPSARPVRGLPGCPGRKRQQPAGHPVRGFSLSAAASLRCSPCRRPANESRRLARPPSPDRSWLPGCSCPSACRSCPVRSRRPWSG